MTSKKGPARNAAPHESSGGGGSHYRMFLKEIESRASELWESALCHGPALNTNELMKEHMMLRESLLEIEAMQHSFAHSSDTMLTQAELRKAALGGFMAWSSLVGINHRAVEIGYFESIDGFGLTSADYATMGTELLQVPRKAILSWDQARKSSFLKRAFDRDIIVRSMENVALALMLCCQKVLPESNWQPYIRVLPEYFSTPLFFAVDELQRLRPSPLFEESLLLYRNVSRQFIHFLLEIIRSDQFRHKKKKPKEEMQKMEPIYVNSPLTAANFTFNLYRWSVACISTRINLIPSEVMKDEMGQPRMIPALIPFLDMANHQFTDDAFHEAVHFSDDSNCAEIIAIHDYKPLEPVNIFYGWRSNRDFLLHNGFVPMEKNIRDVYKLKIGLPKTKREDARMDLFRALGFTIESTVFAFEIKIFEPYFHDSLVQFAQIYVLHEIPQAEESEETINSPDNIRKAWSFLRDRFALLRRAYGDLDSKSSDPLIASFQQVVAVTSESHPQTFQYNQHYDLNRESMIARLKKSEMEILEKAENFCSKQLEAT